MNTNLEGLVGTLRRETRGNTPIIAFNWNAQADQMNFNENTTPTLTRSQEPAVMTGCDNYNGALTGDVAATLSRKSGDGVSSGPSVIHNLSVRRLTPTECERLQGFPDGYTNIPWRTYKQCVAKGWSYEAELKKRGMKLREPSTEACPDGPRYKALGNSMAVPCMRFIGQRIAAVDKKYRAPEDWS